jgi:ABC-type branched-subunit amino acid transport system ATPase component
MYKLGLNSIRNSGLLKSLGILSKTDRRKLLLIVALQSLFNILDLFAIAAIGVVGALSIRGVSAKTPGDRVSRVLNLLGLENFSFHAQIIVFTVIAMFLFMLRTFLSIASTKRTLRFLSNRSAQLTSTLFSKTLNQPLTELQRTSEQSTLYALTNGISIIAIGIIGALATLASDITLLIIIFGGMILVDPITAVASTIFFSVLGLLMYLLLHKRARDLGKLEFELTVASNQSILEALGSYREIFVLNRRAHYIASLRDIRFRLSGTTSEISFIPYMSKYVLESAVVLGGMIIAGIQFAINDASRAVATLAIFLAAGTRIGPAVLRVQQGAIQIRGNLAVSASSLRLIEDLANYEPVLENVALTKELTATFDPTIRITGCSFKYPGATINAIEDLTLTIEKGEFIVLVGTSGSGKSTLVDLILGILDPQKGQVSISSQSPQIAISKWPGSIGYVPQNVMLLNGSIKDNLLMGLKHNETTENQIWKALEIAQLAEFIRSLPDGLESQVGDRGAKLSGGQKQRLGIARAILLEPKLLVLDEATSALDGTTEASISESIASLNKDLTVIVVAHRLSSVKNARKVVFLKEGKIIEVGSFEEIREKVPEFDLQMNKMGLN